MTNEEYIKKLEELKRKAERAIVENIPGIEKDVLQFLSDYMDEKFDTKDGNFVANENAKKALNSFTDIMTAAISELKDYKGSVGQYLKNFKDVSTLMEDYQKSNGFDVKQARLGATQELVVSEIINQYSENGLNPGFVQPLRELLFDNITGGLNKKQAMAQLRDFIASGKDTTGKLHRYLEQTAQQGVDSYTGATNVRIMQTFKIDTFVVSGSLIKTSSPQCRLVINKMDALIDRKDWPKVKDLAEQYGLIEGTTFDNLPINKLHWGCRHEFTPVTLTQAQRDKLTSTPTNPAGGDTAPRTKPTRPTAPKTPERATFKLAASIPDAESWAKEVLKVKFVNFKGVHLDIANDINKSIYNIQNAMPNIRTNGIGSAQEANKAMKAKIAKAYKESDWYKNNIQKYGQRLADSTADAFVDRQVPKVRGGVLAWSSGKRDVKIPGGERLDLSEFEGVFVNNKFAKSKKELDKIVTDGRDSKWFTESADDFGYIMSHEIGHEIDATIGFRNTEVFKDIYKLNNAKEIGVEALTQKLSKYGATAGGNKKHLEHEMIAESWAEFITSKSPRPLAKEIGEAMLKTYYDDHVQGTGTTFIKWKDEVAKSIQK